MIGPAAFVSLMVSPGSLLLGVRRRRPSSALQAPSPRGRGEGGSGSVAAVSPLPARGERMKARQVRGGAGGCRSLFQDADLAIVALGARMQRHRHAVERLLD